MKDNAQLFVEYESKANTWAELQDELNREYGRKLNSAVIHQRLRERKKGKEGTPIKYMYSMISLASQANVEQEVVISYIIDGLPGPPELKTFMFGAENFYEFKKKLQDYELLQSKLSVRSSSKNNAGELSHRRKCFNCGDWTHVGTDCSTKELGPKCYKCQKNGHISSCCPESTSNGNINCMQRVKFQTDEEENYKDETNEEDYFPASPEEDEKMYKRLYYQSKSRQ